MTSPLQLAAGSAGKSHHLGDIGWAVQEHAEAKRETEAAAAAEDEYDEMYDQAVAIVTETQQASISMIQRRLRVGYNRAARMIEQMERDRVVGPADGAKPREVYARKIEP